MMSGRRNDTDTGHKWNSDGCHGGETWCGNCDTDTLSLRARQPCIGRPDPVTASVPVLTITAEMTEVAAKAMAFPYWDAWAEGTREVAREEARAALTAALPLIDAAVRADERAKRAKGETTVGYEYRNYEKLPFADADHAKHPDGPHRCRCACDEFVSPWCHEHGDQVARERREVQTTRSFGDWERYEWPGRGAARAAGGAA